MKKRNFIPFQELKAYRLILRKLTRNDADILFRLRNDDRVNQFIDRTPPETIADLIKWIDKTNKNIQSGECLYWAIDTRIGESLIGTICVWKFTENDRRAEVGFELHPDHQNLGYMREALAAVIQFSFKQLQLNVLEAFTNTGNVSSRKLLESSGFEMDHEKIMTETSTITGENYQTAVYELFRR